MNQPPLLTADGELRVLNALITGRNYPRKFEDAYNAARRLVKQFPEDPRFWSQLVLLCNLTNRHREALQRHQEARVACQIAKTWTHIHDGDCERDHALYWIRKRRFTKVVDHLGKAVSLHWRDINRTAAAHMVRGRLHYARESYLEAIASFAEAHQLWNGIPDSADPQWQFNCDRWLLKALVASGAPQPRIDAVWKRLQEQMSEHGSADLKLRLERLVMKGRYGNLLDDIIESPRGHWVLRRFGLERIARWRLSRGRSR